MTFLWIGIAFISGALPMSVWVGKLALGVDIRSYGDGNPGATNVFRAGGKKWGVVALLLDGFKGLIPVAIANFGWGWEGWALTAVALAPIAGHAYSPFLGGRGGKALAVTFGVWTGLSLFVGPMILGLAFAFWLRLLRPEGWAVLLGSLTLCTAVWLGIWFGATPQSWLWIALGMTLLLAITHHTDLAQRPQRHTG